VERFGLHLAGGNLPKIQPGCLQFGGYVDEHGKGPHTGVFAMEFDELDMAVHVEDV